MLSPLQVSSIHHFYLHLHTPQYYTVMYEKEDLEGVKRSISSLCCACALIISCIIAVLDLSDHYRTTHQLDKVHGDYFYGASCCAV